MKPSTRYHPGGVNTTPTQVAQWAHALRQLHRPHRPSLCPSRTPSPNAQISAGTPECIERKNGWQLAEHAREAAPYGMQRLLSSAVWNADVVRDDLRGYALEQLGTAMAIVVIDETGFPKRGCNSAGVRMQYCGTSGQVRELSGGRFSRLRHGQRPYPHRSGTLSSLGLE